jgi:hypothetical protein
MNFGRLRKLIDRINAAPVPTPANEPAPGGVLVDP